MLSQCVCFVRVLFLLVAIAVPVFHPRNFVCFLGLLCKCETVLGTLFCAL